MVKGVCLLYGRCFDVTDDAFNLQFGYPTVCRAPPNVCAQARAFRASHGSALI